MACRAAKARGYKALPESRKTRKPLGFRDLPVFYKCSADQSGQAQTFE